MPRVLVTHTTFEGALRLLQQNGIAYDVHAGDAPPTVDELRGIVRTYDGVIALLRDEFDASLLEHSNNGRLKVLSNVAVGVDNIDVEAASRCGVKVTHTPGVLTEATAELTIALLLAAARRIPEADAYARSGAWKRWDLIPDLLGTELFGSTLGVIGMGRIGRAVARRARHGLGMSVEYLCRSEPDVELIRDYGRPAENLETLLARSDFVSLHVPLTATTRGMFGAPQIEACKPGAVIVNTSRGPILDEEALVDGLRSGHIAGAGLDVFADEPHISSTLLGLRNQVVLTPHVGSATERTRRRMAELASSNAIAVLRGQGQAHIVN